MNITTRTVELRAEKVAAQYLLDLYPDCEATIDAIVEHSTQQLVLRLSKFVYTSEEVTIELSSPINVWEHAKKEYAPVWFLAKWPVKNKNITIKAKEIFPHLSFVANNRQRNLHYRTYEQSETIYRST